jgi:uncharacterized membrane protein
MQTQRGFDRLVNFSDAVVAIAITLVVLPLVDAAQGIGNRPALEFLQDNVPSLLAAGLSFVVIGSLWRTHHAVFEWMTGYTESIVRLNFVWLAGIVFLPMPTVLIVTGEGSDRFGSSLYIFTMLVSIAALAILHSVAKREGLLRSGLKDDPIRHWSSMVLMAVALVLALFVPGCGIRALLVLFLAWPLGWLRETGWKPFAGRSAKDVFRGESAVGEKAEHDDVAELKQGVGAEVVPRKGTAEEIGEAEPVVGEQPGVEKGQLGE